jgi:hypothetical protein
VAKFHYARDRENIREKSFTYAQDLKNAKLGIGVQLPKELREARKPFYTAMKKAKAEGNHVRFIGAKLFINGEEYIQEPRH